MTIQQPPYPFEILHGFRVLKPEEVTPEAWIPVYQGSTYSLYLTKNPAEDAFKFKDDSNVLSVRTDAFGLLIRDRHQIKRRHIKAQVKKTVDEAIDYAFEVTRLRDQAQGEGA